MNSLHVAPAMPLLILLFLLVVNVVNLSWWSIIVRVSEVVNRSVVDSSSRFDDHAPPTYEMTSGFKLLRIKVVNVAQSEYNFYIKECLFFFPFFS